MLSDAGNCVQGSAFKTNVDAAALCIWPLTAVSLTPPPGDVFGQSLSGQSLSVRFDCSVAM